MRIRNIILVIIGTLILSFAGLNNKFPLLTSDSGKYINSGFSKEIPADRPILYGLFIVWSSLGTSLWFTVFSQTALLALVLYYCFRYFSTNENFGRFYLACLFFVSFLMLASITSSTIDPGIFGCITILCIGILLFANNISKRDVILIATIAVISMGMDISYLLTAVLLVILYILLLLLGRTKQNFEITGISKKRVGLVATLVLTGWLLASVLNFLYGAGFNTIKPDKIADKVLQNSLHRIYDFKIGKIADKSDIAEASKAIHTWYKRDTRECSLSQQMDGWLKVKYLNYSHIISVICFLIFGLFFIFKKRTPYKSLFIYIFIAYILYSLANAIFYGASAISQYQISWLLTVPVFLYLSESSFFTGMKITDNC